VPQETAQIVREGDGRLVSLGGRLAQRLDDDRVEVAQPETRRLYFQKTADGLSG